MLIKEKLLNLKSPEIQGVFSSFLGTYPMDIISIESKLEKLAFCPVTSKNGSERHTRKTRHARDLSQESKFLLFLGQFLDIISILGKPTLQL